MTYLVERLAELRKYLDHFRGLSKDERFPAELVRELEPLPGFRNVLVHEYVGLDMERVMDALDRLDPIDRFVDVIRRMEAESPSEG